MGAQGYLQQRGRFQNEPGDTHMASRFVVLPRQFQFELSIAHCFSCAETLNYSNLEDVFIDARVTQLGRLRIAAACIRR